MPVYVCELEPVDDKTFYFMTSQQVLGTFEKEKEICFRSLEQFVQNNEEINHIRLYNNLFSEQGEIPFSVHKHKSILSIKAKNLLRTSSTQVKPCQERQIFVSRINQHKDMTMLRLSNKCLQVIYDHSRDGFFYDIVEEKLFYFAKL